MAKILKFGGSSLQNPERIQYVANIVVSAAKKTNSIVVVSAFHNVTNLLIECANLAAAKDETYLDLFNTIAKRHRDALQELLPRSKQDAIESLLKELESNLQGIHLLHECSKRSLDIVASFGELLSAQIITLYLQSLHPAEFVDARKMIVTDDQYTLAQVLYPETNKAIQDYFKKISPSTIPVVTGFIAATKEGQTTTIGRNGSDYSAAIIGAALNADMIEIWTDVDGIYTADPRIVEKAYVIPHMTYEEAMELSHFGAKVLHSASIAPAIKQQIPILIKNTFNPSAPGTLINSKPDTTRKGVKGISSIADVTLLTLRGINMVGVPGTAERLFRALARQNINVILISQASSEHTICFAINDSDVKAAEMALNNEFRFELENQLIKLENKLQQTIIAVVGDDMIGTPGIAGKFCYALGQNKVNINAIAQGASERNISLAINAKQSMLALNAVHQFFFEAHKRLALCFIGVGNVGAALLSLIEQQTAALYEKGYDVKVCVIANSKQYIFDPKGIDLQHWKLNLENSKEKFDIQKILQLLATTQFTHTALVDCTASSDIVESYPTFVENNVHIVTPNKKANVLPWKQYQAFIKLLESRQCHFLFEANVGAGLPIISTLQDLLIGGDTIIKIEGIFSGTLSYIFNQYDGTEDFSEIIKQAHEQGFTEPDPREDLSGTDVARKLLILARQLGRKMDFEDIVIENLIPEHLREGQFSAKFYQHFQEYNDLLKRKVELARQNDCVLRYVGVLDEKGARAELQDVPQNHPLALAKHSDNIIAFTTQRYSLSPLVVQGPGAGAAVTAMGVFSDVVKLLHYLPY